MSGELSKLFPKASPDFLRLNGHCNIPLPPHNPAPDPQPKRRVRDGALAARKTKKGYSAFYVIRITSFRSRLIDSDNLCGKWHCDALRYAGIIPSDAPDRARIETAQIKCPKGQERTEIEIIKTP